MAIPLAISFGLGAIFGAPYLPIRKEDKEKILDLSDIVPGKKVIDLGCGDGTFLISVAKRGAEAIGYEINPLLCVVAYLRCFKHRHLVSIRWANLWSQSLPPADLIYVFLIERYAKKLSRKLTEEISTPTKVVSYIFELPGLKPTKVTRNCFIYQLPQKP